MGALVTVMVSSRNLKDFHIQPRAREALIANGWQPPTHQTHTNSQDPTPGPFLLPKEAPCET